MSTPETEPVRRNLYPAAFVAALAAFCSPLATAPDITAQVIFGALGLAAGSFAAVAFAAEHARSKVSSPATTNEIISAEHVIREAEGA